MEDLFSTFSADQLTDNWAYGDVLVQPAYEWQRKWWTTALWCV